MARDPVWHSHACGGIFGGNLFHSRNVSDRKSDFWHDGGGRGFLCHQPVEDFPVVSGNHFPYDASGIGNHGIADPDN